jgi:hypothetical protein
LKLFENYFQDITEVLVVQDLVVALVRAALVDQEASVAALVVQEVLADQVSVVAMVNHMDILIKTASKRYFF